MAARRARGLDGLEADFERSILRFLPAAVRRPRAPAQAIAAGWVVAFLPSILLAAAATVLAPGLARPDFPAGGALLVFLLVVFSPLVETLVMAAALEVLRLALPPSAALLASALGWGIAHSLAAPAWGLVIWWPFLVFSTLYLTWRGSGRARAVAIVFATHALQNLPVALLLVQR